MAQQGRVVIPAGVRAALGLVAGDRLHLHREGCRLVLERPEDAVAELRGLAAHVPGDRSLVDELLAERQAECQAERPAECPVECPAEGPAECPAECLAERLAERLAGRLAGRLAERVAAATSE